MLSTRTIGAVVVVGLIVLPSLGSAETLVPGPKDSGYSSALADKAAAYWRQQQELLSVPLGWGLEAYVSDPASRKLVEGFFTAKAADFKGHTGKHAYEVIASYGEFGDLGMFGGVQVAGDAFRYAVLRDGGAPAAQVAEARAALLRALDGLHWFTQITGKPGIVARGLRRITPEAGEPPLPGTTPPTVPLFDSQGKPQPADKKITWRKDQSGKLPFLIWLDDCSKDQLDGYVFALGVFYDVIKGDATIPADRITRLQADAKAIGQRLMEQVDVGYTKKLDLVIQDADGRPTTFHDLSAEEIAPGVGWHQPVNGFNGVMGLGIVRTLYHVGGDVALGRFYYEELIGKRGYLKVIEDTLALVYLGKSTNYSNVNMAFTAIYGLLRYESDPALAKQIRTILEQKLYAPGVDRQAKGLQQSFFDFIYAGFRAGGIGGAGAAARADGLLTLQDFPAPPFWDEKVENCDAQEIAALQCTAIDGSSLKLFATGPGKAVSETPLPMKIRPMSNFYLRSDPHDLNSNGGSRLNPGAGYQVGYWMGRLFEASTSADGTDNVSPHARPALPTASPDGGSVADGGTTDAATADAGEEPAPGDDGCGCRVEPARARSAPLLALLLVVLLLLRRRSA